MPSKKTIKKKPSKSKVKAPLSRKKLMTKQVRAHGHFIAILGLFVVVSLVAIFSFWSSTNMYLENMYASVVDVDGGEVVEEESVLGWNEPVEIFKDVWSDHINAEAIENLYYQGIINGYDDGSFKPDNNINRAEFLVVLTNVVDADFGGMVLSNCFTDVKEEWYATFVCYAKENGWVRGFEDGSFSPDQFITKAEVLKISFEALDYAPCEVLEVAPYEDVDLEAWYAIYACSGKIGGIIPKAGKFNAGNEVTRAELAEIIYKLMGEKAMF
jgi:hypothetical protein